MARGRFTVFGRCAPAARLLLGSGEGVGVDDRLVGEVVGPHPVGGIVPAELGLVPGGDVVDVEEYFVVALPVPYLSAAVSGVLDDGPHGGLAPGAVGCGAVSVAGWVVRAGGRDAIGGQRLGDRPESSTGEVVVEDALDDRRGAGVDLETVLALAGGCFRWVGVGAGVAEQVAVGRPSAEEAALGGGLGCHGAADADLDPVAFALAHAAVEAHDHVVGVGSGVDLAADLGYPQLDAVVDEHWERESELLAVERSGRFADHDCVEPSVRVA
ncbi:MAG: hypothetical protein V9E94_12190 [Microthrixaceae bacterium]